MPGLLPPTTDTPSLPIDPNPPMASLLSPPSCGIPLTEDDSVEVSLENQAFSNVLSQFQQLFKSIVPDSSLDDVYSVAFVDPENYFAGLPCT